MKTLWDDEHLSVNDKANRIEFILRNKYRANGSRIIKVPSMKYPLFDDKYIVSVSDTATQITDPATLSILDSIKFIPGNPYRNAINTVSEFRKHQYDVRIYTGWLFSGDTDDPVPYCWCMLGDSVIDLSQTTHCVNDLSAKALLKCSLAGIKVTNKNKIVYDAIKETNRLPNHIRCYPVGIPDEKNAYIGSECLPEECEFQYKQLISYNLFIN